MRKTTMLFVTLFCVFASSVRAANVTALGKLTINDTFVTSQLLFSDAKGTYTDYRVPGGDPCVTSFVQSNGFFFIYLYQGSGLGDRCNDAFPTQVRTYVLRFPAGSGVCAAFNLPVDPTGTCQLILQDKPRIRADKLFAQGTQTTPVAFMFFRNGTSYSLEPDKGVTITGSGSTRTLTYFDTATLKKISASPQPQPVGSSFVFPFQVSVTEVPQ